MSYYPEDWIAMRDRLHGWLAGELDPITVIWQEQDAPRPEKPYAALRVLSEPATVGQASESAERAVQVVDAQDATAYELAIDGETYSFTSGAGATLAQIRDGLIDEVNDALPGVAHAIAADALGLRIAGDAELSVADEELLAVKLAQIYLGQGEMVLEVDGFSTGRDELTAIMAAAKLGLETSSVREYLASEDVAVVGVVGSRYLASVTNGLWEHRRGFDVRLRVTTRSVEIIDLIEQIADGGVQLTVAV